MCFAPRLGLMPRRLRLNVCGDHAPDQQRAADQREQDREDFRGLDAIREFADRGLTGDLKSREETEGDEHG